MIVVMPNGNGAQGAVPGEYPNSMYKPLFANPKTMEGSFEKAFPDIMKYVESHYRTIMIKSPCDCRTIDGWIPFSLYFCQ